MPNLPLHYSAWGILSNSSNYDRIVAKVDPLYPLLPQIMPLFSTRLGQIKIIETSEEIRLDLVKTLNQVVLKTGENFAPFIEDVSLILHRVMTDSFQDIRKVRCWYLRNKASNQHQHGPYRNHVL